MRNNFDHDDYIFKKDTPMTNTQKPSEEWEKRAKQKLTIDGWNDDNLTCNRGCKCKCHKIGADCGYCNGISIFKHNQAIQATREEIIEEIKERVATDSNLQNHDFGHQTYYEEFELEEFLDSIKHKRKE